MHSLLDRSDLSKLLIHFCYYILLQSTLYFQEWHLLVAQGNRWVSFGRSAHANDSSHYLVAEDNFHMTVKYLLIFCNITGKAYVCVFLHCTYDVISAHLSIGRQLLEAGRAVRLVLLSGKEAQCRLRAAPNSFKLHFQ